MPKARIKSADNRRDDAKGKFDFISNLKLKHSFSDQIRPLRDFLFAAHLDSFRNTPLATSFSDYIANGVLHNGRGFLKLHRSLLIQGLKVLTGDPNDKPSFNGFKLTKNGYPCHYDEIFNRLRVIGNDIYHRVEDLPEPILTQKQIAKELVLLRRTDSAKHERFVSGVAREEYTRWVGELKGKFMQLPAEPTLEMIKSKAKLYGSEVRTLLTLLNWPKFVTLDMSEEERVDTLVRFAELISSFKSGDKEYYSGLFAQRLADHYKPVWNELVRHKPEVDLHGLGQIGSEIVAKNALKTDLSKRTYKGFKETPGTIPHCVAYMNDLKVNPLFVNHEPTARTTVLAEKAGKTRIIASYNSLVNGTGVYENLRSILDKNNKDSSADQSKGHEFARKVSEQGLFAVCADLSEFTDGLTSSVLYPFLDNLGIHDFMGVINSPIIVGESIVKPVRPLMGLRGTFEIASIIHHAVCDFSQIKHYVVCGDDLLFVDECGKNSALKKFETYKSSWDRLGISVNKTKTIAATGFANFCGKYYLFGIDITPTRVPLASLAAADNQLDLLSVGSQVIENSRGLKKTVFKKIASQVIRLCAKRIKRGIPKELPRKLGGLGLSKGRGLLDILSKRWVHPFVILPEIRLEPDAYVTRRYLPIRSEGELCRFPFTPNLLIKGWYTSKKRVRVIKHKMSYSLKDIVSILEYYYSIGDYAGI